MYVACVLQNMFCTVLNVHLLYVHNAVFAVGTVSYRMYCTVLCTFTVCMYHVYCIHCMYCTILKVHLLYVQYCMYYVYCIILYVL